MKYAIVDGFNNEMTLEELDPQPSTPGGIQTADRIWAADGSSYPDGQKFVELVFTFLEDQQKTDMDTDLGVSEDVTSNQITVRLRTNSASAGVPVFANYNGVVHFPETIKRDMVGWSQVIYRVTGLEAL